MSRRTTHIKQLRRQQSELHKILPARAISTGRKSKFQNGHFVSGVGSGLVGTVPAKDATVARWAKFWKGA
jgi:hypothetical protein